MKRELLATATAATLFLSASCMPETLDAPPATSGHASSNMQSVADGTQTQVLMAAEAPLNIIYIPDTQKPVETSDEDPAATNKGWRALLAGDTKYRKGLQDGFAAATHDRYRPQTVSYVITGAMAIAACIDSTDPVQAQSLYDHAAAYKIEGALNVIVVGQSGCTDKNASSSLAGYSSADADPVITLGAVDSPETFAQIIVHEEGHSAGLDHAGVASCKNILQILGCSIDPTADPNSIMGYTFGPDNGTDFTAPELFKIGLLGQSEQVVDPQDGIYELAGTDTKSRKTIKVMAVKGVDNTTEYFSWEPDTTAVNDIKCVPLTDGNANKPNVAYLSSSAGTENADEVCLKVNQRKLTHSLQTRIDVPASDDGTSEASLALVARQRRGSAPYYGGSEVTSGEVKPAQILYENANETITYLGTMHGDGLVRVMHK